MEKLSYFQFDLLIVAFTGMFEHDVSCLVDDLLRGPILVVVGVPRCIFIVLRYRVLNRMAFNGGFDCVGGFLEGKLGRVYADDDEAPVLVSIVKPIDVGNMFTQL